MIHQFEQGANEEVDGSSEPHPGVNKKTEGNAGYQVLGDPSRPSIYNQLERNVMKKIDTCLHVLLN